MTDWEAIDRRIQMHISPSPQVEVLRGIVDQVQPDGQTYSAFFGGSAVSWPKIYYGAVEAPQPTDQVTVHYRREDGYTEHLGVTGRPLTTADPIDLSGLVTDQELADHAALPIHLLSYNTPNTTSVDAGHWSLIGSGQMDAQYSQLVATVLINGNGGLTTAFTRGTLRLRIRQDAAFPADPIALLELLDPGGMVAGDVVLVVTGNAGPTTYELYVRLTRDNEWLSFIPMWTEALGTAHVWSGCNAFVTSLPGGTQFVAV